MTRSEGGKVQLAVDDSNERSSDQEEQQKGSKASLLANFAKSTGYPVVQQNGQRRYGPPSDWLGAPPQKGCEVFVGKLPRDVMEYELVPVFERIGQIYEMRMMMDFNGSNRGYAFITYCDKQSAKRACQELNGYEIRRGRYIGVLKSVDNCRLYVSGIPRDKNREDVLLEMSRLSAGVVDVILYPSAVDKSKNRGFAFVEYESHRCAAMARRKLAPNRLTLWGNDITVDWAEPERDVDEETMAQVKKLYIRNLMIHTTEELIRQTVESVSGPGTVERVKKIRDYAFVHFGSREDAIKVQEALNNTNLDGSVVEVKLAKPPDRSIMRFVKNAQKLAAQLYSAGVNGAEHVTEITTGKMVGREVDPSTNVSVYMGFPCIDPFAMRPAYPAGVAIPNGRLSTGGTGRFVGRGAAGMRAASFQAMLNSTFRKQRSQYVDALEEHCKQNNWGTPTYRLKNVVNGIETVGDAVNLFSYYVEIPSLIATHGTFDADQMLPDKLEAREAAAEHALNQLGVTTAREHCELGYQEEAVSLVPPTTCIRSPSGDSGISAGSIASTKVTATYDVQSPFTPVPLSGPTYSTAPTLGYHTAAGYENFMLSDVGAFQPFLVHTVPFGAGQLAGMSPGAWTSSFLGVSADGRPCFAPAFSVPPAGAYYVNFENNSGQPISGCMSTSV